MDNRLKLLAVTLDLFAAYGYEGVGVQRIVEAAEVTKPTLYHYFGSKHGLLAALLETHFNRLFAVLEPAAAYSGDLPLTLTRIATAYFDFAVRNPVFYRMYMAMRFTPPQSEAFQAMAPFNERQQLMLERVFQLAVDQHGNMRGRHQAYAATFRGMIHTYIGMFLDGYIQFDDATVYRAMHQFMHGIFS
jgi:TetR/AcrR family transcriptional regulator